MSVTSIPCPALSELLAYQQRKLSASRGSAIEQHLTVCPRCQSQLRGATRLGQGKTHAPSQAPPPMPLTTPYLPEDLTQLGKYRLLGRLGQGGMGAVFRAEDTQMHREVALKIIHAESATDAELLRRFKTEVRAAAQLEHSNIVRAYAAELDSEPYYLVMELIDGMDLHRLVQQRGPLEIRRVCIYVRQAALGLQYAHEKGLVHRDIKPHNLMVTRRNEVKILDFGLAKQVSNRTQAGGATTLGVMMGTPQYVAPEQSLNAREADIRSDIYSLGCTLYYLLTGKPPFVAETEMQTILAHHEQQRPWLLDARPEAPPELGEVVRRMMARKPEERYQQPREVAEALQRFTRSGESVTAKLPAAGPEPVKPPPLPTVRSSEPIVVKPPLPKRQGGQSPLWLALAGAGGALVLLVLFAVWQASTSANRPGQGKGSSPLGSSENHRTELGNGSNKLEPSDKNATAGGSKEAIASSRELTNSIGMKLVLIPAGTFLMGSPEGEAQRSDDERPQHEVEITRPFYLGVHEVTQEQYERLMGENPSHFQGDTMFPVDNVTWQDAVDFCRKLSERPEEKQAGRIYRLPTEAEWEYACRGPGSYQVFHFGNSLSSKDANFDGNFPYGNAPRDIYRQKPTPVGWFRPNAWGLYDMHGNVWEWCQDWYSENYYTYSPRRDPTGPATGSGRVIRGGCWYGISRNCRSAGRNWYKEGYRGNSIGFRVALIVLGPGK